MRDPAAVLARLVAEAPGVEPVILERLRLPAGDAADEALDFLFRRLEGLFREAVAAVRERWGEPSFEGSVEDDDFPPWADGLLAAAWRRGDAVAWLAVRHDDDDAPLTLEAAALTRAEIEAPEGWPKV